MGLVLFQFLNGKGGLGMDSAPCESSPWGPRGAGATAWYHLGNHSEGGKSIGLHTGDLESRPSSSTAY